MSQLASIVQLPIPALQLLIPAAMRRRKWFGKPESKLQDYLNQHGTDLGGFDQGDGFYLVVALLYLRRYSGVNLLDGNKGTALMAQSLTKHQDTFFTFFADEDRASQAAVLSTVLDATKLKTLCDDEGIDSELFSDLRTLKAAIGRIASLLAAIPDEHVVLMSVG